MATKKKTGWAYLLCALIPLIVFTAATVIVVATKKNEVVKNTGFARQGYPDVPTTYQVTASPHKVFADLWEDSKLIIIIGWLVAVVLPPLYFYSREKAGKDSSWQPVLLLWGLGVVLTWGVYTVSSGRLYYTETLTEQQFNAHAEDLDSLFP